VPLSSVTRNNHCMRLEKQYKDRRAELKKLIKQRRANPNIDISEHMKHVFALDSLPRNSSKKRIRNRCAITGRGRGVWRFFGICGMKIRELSMQGLLPGVYHASW
jgi:small subunit ribosomal protein S14